MGNDLHQNGIILGEGTNADIDTTEEDIVVVTDLKMTKVTQISVLVKALTLGTNTSLELRFYTLTNVGGTWIERVKQNASDNTLDDFPAIIDGSTPNGGLVNYELPMPAGFGFKVTGKGAGGADTSVTIKLVGRYN